MQTSPASSTKLIYGLFIAALTWFAWITQWCITSFGFIDFISFFTVQCNLLVALCLSFSLLAPNTVLGNFFSKTTVQTAIALYIFIVGLVYNTVLRGLYSFAGMQWLIDNLMHVVVPMLFVIYWFFFTTRVFLKWKDCIYWLIYPLLYTLYSMIRGAFVHWYPYPFLNAEKLGYPQVFINMLVVLAAFLVTGLILIAVKRKN
ncbi:MAG: Pr6Pr family membrane protein [Bacteroidota bacterium]